MFKMVILIVCVLFFIFFFKQKTAYEMRISDWSSDVCSSDLAIFEVEPWEQEYFTDKLQGKVNLEFFSHRLTVDNMHEAAQAEYIVSFIYSDLSHQVFDRKSVV